MSDAYEPGIWYVEPSNLDTCVYIESLDHEIAEHVRPDDAVEIVAAHNGRQELVKLLTRYEATLTIQEPKLQRLQVRMSSLARSAQEYKWLDAMRDLLVAENTLMRETATALRAAGVTTV